MNLQIECAGTYLSEEMMRYRSLWACVILDAVRTHKTGRSNGAKYDATERRMATRWISDSSDHPTSFVWCCEFLGLCPQRMKKELGL